MRLISVVLGAKTDRIRFNESEKLLTGVSASLKP